LKSSSTMVLTPLALVALIESAPTQAQNIHVVREIQVSQHTVSPHVVVRTDDGGYVVARSSGVSDTHGWATRLDSNDKPLWEYLDGPAEDWSSMAPSVNRFTSAVVLPSDKVLLCGTKDHRNEIPKKGDSGRLVVIDAAGHREEQDIYPEADPQSLSAKIYKCVRWGDGIALVGETWGATPSGWLAKLDLSGRLVWEKLAPFIVTLDAVETPKHDLLVLSWVYEAQGTYAILSKVDQTGAIVFTRQVAGGGDQGTQFVRPVSGPVITILLQDHEPEMKVLRLDYNTLQNVGKPAELGRFNSDRSYMLPDQTTVIFGGTFHRGDTAAVPLLPKNSSSVSVTAVEPLNYSSGINDATPAGKPNEFATVRRAGNCAVLTWVSVRQNAKTLGSGS
jgi:hypothetical protein